MAGIFALLAIVPDYIATTRFLYTASEIPTPKTPAFDMEAEFDVIAPSGAKKRTSLKELVHDRPGGLLVNFWATWCPPCLEELPALEHLHRQLEATPNPNLPRLVTFSVDDSAADVLKLFPTLVFRPTFLVLHDTESDYAEKAGTTRFPETYWIRPDGTVRHKWLGPQNWLSDAVQRHLAAP